MTYRCCDLSAFIPAYVRLLVVSAFLCWSYCGFKSVKM